MYRPLGRPNCFHSAMNFPSESKICRREFPRSPTNTRPRESSASACAFLNSPGPVPSLPHSLMNLPSRRKLHDASDIIRRHLRILPGVAVSDVDIAVGRGDDIGRLVEMCRAAAGNAGRAKPHQHLAVRRQLDDLLPFRPVLARLRVGHPDVAVAIDVQSVRKDEQARRRCSSSAAPSRDPSGGSAAGPNRRRCSRRSDRSPRSRCGDRSRRRRSIPTFGCRAGRPSCARQVDTGSEDRVLARPAPA